MIVAATRVCMDFWETVYPRQREAPLERD
jgi:hypothetical protein